MFLPLNLLSLVLALCFIPAICLAKRPPDWLEALREQPVPDALLDSNPKAVLVYDEGIYDVKSDGAVVKTLRGAVLIRNLSVREEAVARMVYSEDTDKPISIGAWMLPPEGRKAKVIEYKKRDAVDRVVESAGGSVVSSMREMVIDASGDALRGSLFGFEMEMEDDGTSPEMSWSFQGDIAFGQSRLELRLPEGWDFSAKSFGEGVPEPVRAGGAYIWETGPMEGLEAQPMGTVNPARIVLALHAPNGQRDSVPSSWGELAQRYWPYYNSQRELTDEMSEKVAELLAGESDPVGRVRTLAEYVQSVNYLSIALDLGKGGGHRPRPPPEVFSSNYGDCKDKSNLLVALLADQGVEAYPLIVDWGSDRLEVLKDWVSPSQFNHCVTAIKMPEGFESPNAIEHEGLGRLLVFDPTNEYAVFGDLDNDLQGSRGMLLAGEHGGLVELPTLPLAESKIRREVSVKVFLDGVLAEMVESSRGQAAASERRVAFTDDSSYQERISRWLADSVPSVRVLESAQSDDRESDRFSLKAKFFGPGYGKNLRNRTLIFKPILIERLEALPFGVEERAQPVVLRPRNLDERYQYFLPEGFEVAELPEDTVSEEDFGRYALRFAHDSETRILTVERELTLRARTIPLEDFSGLESFFQRRIQADQSAVVLEAL